MHVMVSVYPLIIHAAHSLNHRHHLPPK